MDDITAFCVLFSTASSVVVLFTLLIDTEKAGRAGADWAWRVTMRRQVKSFFFTDDGRFRKRAKVAVLLWFLFLNAAIWLAFLLGLLG
jgi:hypothetical protein